MIQDYIVGYLMGLVMGCIMTTIFFWYREEKFGEDEE